MAHDTKQLKTFKFLQKIAEGKQRYCWNAYNPYNEVYTIFGVLYATNGVTIIGSDESIKLFFNSIDTLALIGAGFYPFINERCD